jgi:ribonuclease P protein component
VDGAVPRGLVSLYNPVFPGRKRLPRAQFPVLMMSGRRFSSPHFTAVVSDKTEGYAVIVPKKVARLSVIRHKIKRRVFAALRNLPLPKALIIFPKTSVSSVSYQDIHAELKKLLS